VKRLKNNVNCNIRFLTGINKTIIRTFAPYLIGKIEYAGNSIMVLIDGFPVK